MYYDTPSSRNSLCAFEFVRFLFETSCDLCIIMAVPIVETGLISLFQVSNIRYLFQ